MVQRLEAWMHRQVQGGPRQGAILEIGAGTLNHLPFERNWERYDVVEPFEDLWRDSPARARVTRFYSDIADVPLEPRYDRIISVAVLEHLTDLPAIVAQSALRLRADGEFTAAFPSEGGALWGLAWRATTGVSYRMRTGLPYAAVMRHEHVNTAAEIRAVLGYFFDRLALARFPAPLHHLSFYTAVRARGPRRLRAEPWLAAR
jgi:SAM-dependent methyltransferase